MQVLNLLTLISIYLFITVILTVFFAVYALVNGRSKPAVTFSLMCLFIAVYVFGYVMELNSQSLGEMQFWNQIQYIGIPFFPALLLILSLQYAKKRRYLKPALIVLMFAVAAFNFIAHFTNSYHHLFYTEYVYQVTGPFPVMSLIKGPLYIVQAAFSLFCMAASAFLFIRPLRFSEREERNSLILALSAAILPCIGALMIAWNTLSLGLDYGAFISPISCLLLLISIFKFQFLNLKPLVYRRVFEGSSNGIIVLKDYMIADFNRAAAGIFPELKKSSLYKNIFSHLGIYEPLVSAIAERKEEQIEVRLGDKSRYYYITVSDIVKNRGSSGLLIFLTDITRNIEIMKAVEKSEQKNRLLLTQMRQGLLVCEMTYTGGERDFICIDENPTFESITGFKRQEILGNSIFKLYPDMRDKLFTRFEDVCLTGRSQQAEYLLPEKGNYFDIVLYSPQPRQFAMIVSDITERKEMYEMMKDQRAVLTAIAKASGEMLSNRGLMSALAEGMKLVGLSTDADKVSLYINRYDKEQLKFIASHEIEWDGKSGEANLNPAALQSFSLEELDDFTRSLAAGRPFTNLVVSLPKSGFKEFFETNRIKSYLIFPLFSEKNLWGFIAFYNCKAAKVWKNSEISVLSLFADAMSGAVERHSFEKKIEVLSYHDQLTGLYNRRFFEEETERLDTKRNLPLTVIIADVNGLKLTNDAFGHFLGDKLLKKAADVFCTECRADDIIARIGGDEFSILLPKTDSREALRIIRRIQSAILEDTTENIILSISFGYSTKYEPEEAMIEVIKKAEDHMYNNKLSESLKIRSRTLEIIKKKLYGKNEREQKHSERVGKLCREIGKAMSMNPIQLKELETAGMLHDIGKIAVEDRILNKEEELDQSEMLKIRRHAEIGYHILSSVGELAQVAHYVLAHQERWDGTGYPKQLKGHGIPVQSRIIAIADAYDAMTTPSPFRKPISEEEAAQELKNNAGRQFDPEIVKVFLEKVLHLPGTEE